ncbi:DUF1446 domain-containing protein, partial [Burkholderia sp. Cy-647]|uniref:acyclic terpene utilization AtuA family protein n=1 Tax=Burkholderia sp. Cy-647 TaxID=2608328 RepID=UPI001421A563
AADAVGAKTLSNLGAATRRAAARETARIAAGLGIAGLRIAAVSGDDVLEPVLRGGLRFVESGEAVADYRERIVSANAYLGAEPIVAALAAGADIVLTGRVADPALFAAPLIHEFGWRMDDWARLGQATVVGHLLECAGQVTGGYFADPGWLDVPDLARLGFPIGEVAEDGAVTITKLARSGGRVSAETCKQQLIYEIHDPARYLQPDVTADFSRVTVSEEGPDRVRVTGGAGRARPDTLKVSVAYADGHIGEGQISYGGPGALARARLAGEIVRERLKLTGVATSELRIDLIGVDSLYGATGIDARDAREAHEARGEPAELRLRVAGRCATAAEAARIGNEVETLYTNGPAGGGGATKAVREVLAVQSVLLPREQVRPVFTMLEVDDATA